MERLECDRMFVAVMEVGSFAAAAQRLSTSNGQASKLISRLEQELGVQLFKRTTRALVATEIGRAYYERVKRLLGEYDALNDDIRNTSESPSGTVRISAPVTFGVMQLSMLLSVFAKRYPQIELDVNFSDRLVNVVDDGFDLALRIGNLTDSSLIARKLCDIALIHVASPDYLQQHGALQHWQELVQHECIIDTNLRDPFIWPFFDKNHIRHDYAVNGRLKFSNAEVCLNAACAGLGIARLPLFVAADALRSKRVVSVLTDFELPILGLYALYPPAKHLARKSRVVIDFLVDALSGQPTWSKKDH